LCAGRDHAGKRAMDTDSAREVRAANNVNLAIWAMQFALFAVIFAIACSE